MALPANWIFIEAANAVQLCAVPSDAGVVAFLAKAIVVDDLAYPVPGDIPSGGSKYQVYSKIQNNTGKDAQIKIVYNVIGPDGTVLLNSQVYSQSGTYIPKAQGTDEFTDSKLFVPTMAGIHIYSGTLYWKDFWTGINWVNAGTFSFEFNITTVTDPMSEMMNMMMTMMMLGMMMSMMKGMMPGDEEDKSKKKFKNPEGPKPPLPIEVKKEIVKPIEQVQQPPTIKKRIIEEY